MDACKPKTSPIMDFGELQVWDEYLDFEDLSTRMVRNIIESHRALLVKANGLQEKLDSLERYNVSQGIRLDLLQRAYDDLKFRMDGLEK